VVAPARLPHSGQTAISPIDEPSSPTTTANAPRRISNRGTHNKSPTAQSNVADSQQKFL